MIASWLNCKLQSYIYLHLLEITGKLTFFFIIYFVSILSHFIRYYIKITWKKYCQMTPESETKGVANFGVLDFVSLHVGFISRLCLHCYLSLVMGVWECLCSCLLYQIFIKWLCLCVVKISVSNCTLLKTVIWRDGDKKFTHIWLTWKWSFININDFELIIFN